MSFKDFIKSFTPWEVRPPKWDVSLVLRSLMRHPYESLMKTSETSFIRHFLLALVLAKRVSELHCLFTVVHHSVVWHSLSFSFLLDFRVKTQNQWIFSTFPPGFHCQLSGWTGAVPVRDIQLYLKRTKQYGPGCKCFFISTGWNTKEVFKIAISFWLYEIIKRVYQFLDREDLLPHWWAHKLGE